VQDKYNGYEQLVTEYQNHNGPVSTQGAGSLAVQYGYNNPGTGNYSRPISIGYPNGRYENYEYNFALDNAISRIDGISESNGQPRAYEYLGLSTAVTFDGNNVTLTYLHQSGDTLAGSDAGDQYTGLDRFGRVVDQNWTGPSSAIDRFQYGYDADGNVLYKSNLLDPNFSELYTYDQLNRLKSFQRGTLNSAYDAIVTPNPLAGSSNDWNMDAVGNITSVGGVSHTENALNQVTQVGSAGIDYDASGNMLTDEQGNTFTYDAWKHIVTVNGTYAYQYDAFGRRMYEGTTGLDLYYNTTGSVIEERNHATGSVTAQYVWGMGYVNNLVLQDVQGTRSYVHQDANWNVTSVTNISATVVQRMVYDPYGSVTYLTAAWGSGSNGVGLQYSFQGGRIEGSYIHFGARDYNPSLGVWMQEDPAGYVNGANLYQLAQSNPVALLDPHGTQAQSKGYGGQAFQLACFLRLRHPCLDDAEARALAGAAVSLHPGWSQSDQDDYYATEHLPANCSGPQKPPPTSGCVTCTKWAPYWRARGYSSWSACTKAEYARFSTGIPGTIIGGASGVSGALLGASGSSAGPYAGLAGYGITVYELGDLANAAVDCSESTCVAWK